MKTNYLNEFVSILLDTKTEKDLKEFLKAILTPKELDEIPTRLEIVRQLKAGIPQHEIAKKLGVGVATVTRGSIEIKKGHFKNIK